jgi:dihydrodipicolinate synthase/N-acetylneuraminate lyase
MDEYPALDAALWERVREGMVIPAHPLALTESRQLDEQHQRALARYYLDAGAAGLAVGVHTTEFKIHDPAVGLYQPVLQLAIDTARSWAPKAEPFMIAGVIGSTDQAVREAGIAKDLGYHAAMISFGALKEASDEELVAHAEAVAQVMPIFGFYLQPAVGGRVLSEAFWRSLVQIPNLVGIKIAPFNRYYTLNVVRAVAREGKADTVALYTGNDDAILYDLLTTYEVVDSGNVTAIEVVGGLLGHWAYWTQKASKLWKQACEARRSGTVSAALLTLAAQVTETNMAVFDPDNGFRGCIAGILYVLERVGLVAGVYPLDDRESLSPGQTRAIEAAIRSYPHLVDDEFVEENRSRWLEP